MCLCTIAHAHTTACRGNIRAIRRDNRTCRYASHLNSNPLAADGYYGTVYSNRSPADADC